MTGKGEFMSIAFSKENLKFAQDLRALTGENALLCHQCKKCTLGCPSAYAMRMKPHELMRALQLGLSEEIYWSGTIWICLSCETCNTRCPQSIHILRIINGLRELSKEVDYYNPYPAVPALHRIFMALVERFGKVYQLGLTLLIHFRMLTPFKDIDMASPMLMKGKLELFPHKSHGVKELRQVMARIKKLEKEQSVPVQAHGGH
jgi:heterodisulfide reductase subunit C2